MSQVVDNNREVKEKPPKKLAPNTISHYFYLLLTLWIILLILDRFFLSEKVRELFNSLPGMGIIVVLFAVLGALVWRTRTRLNQILTSPQFAVAILAWLLGFIIMGTLIVQSGSQEQLAEVYGRNIGELIYLTGFNDIFHSVWFGGFAILLGISLILVVIKRKSWRFPEWGNLFAHLGIVVILVGAFLGYFFGFKGMIDLHIGESADQAVETRLGLRSGNLHPLNFSIRLEDFQIEYYPPKYKLYLYQRKRDSFTVKKSFALKQVADWTSLDDSGVQFRVTKIYPDFYFQPELKETTEKAGKPAIQLELDEGQTKRIVNLFAGEPQRDTIVASSEALLIRFVWEPLSKVQLENLGKTKPAMHIVTFEKPGCCPRQELAVKLGEEYLLGQGGRYRLKVLQYLPDFIYNFQTRKAETRSNEPNNPALQVSLTETETGETDLRWLFAKVPEFGKVHGMEAKGLELSYSYIPEHAPPAKELVIIGKTRTAVKFEEGKLEKIFPLPSEQQPLPATPILSFKIYPFAEEVKKPATRSQEWKNPVVELEIKQGDKIQTHLLSSGHEEPMFLPDGKSALALESKGDEVKAYRSKLAVLQAGRKVMETTIAVNSPLYYQGYGFYQSNYKKEDPSYSGIMVVKDPGLVLVWIGFGMITFGLIFIYYVRPRLAKRK